MKCSIPVSLLRGVYVPVEHKGCIVDVRARFGKIEELND